MKSLSSALLAIEIYNKPKANYREESFSILMINAYELLFKAKILKDTNQIKNLYVYEKRKLIDDSSSARKYIKKNRSNQPYTIGIENAMNILRNQKKIDINVVENINLLLEIRDNSIHFINDNDSLNSELHNISSAAVKNYYNLVEEWFKKFDITQYNFFITPLNFRSIDLAIDPLTLSVAQQNFLNYINIAKNAADIKSERYDVIIKQEIKFVRTTQDKGILISQVKNGKKLNVELTDDIFSQLFPLTYEQIVKKIKEKNPSFKLNKKFHQIKTRFQEEEKYCRARYLNTNKTGTSKYYYNSQFIHEILNEYSNT